MEEKKKKKQEEKKKKEGAQKKVRSDCLAVLTAAGLVGTLGPLLLLSCVPYSL